MVVATVPESYAVDSAFTGPVRFRFDERISERVSSGALESAVLVSPRTGEVEVDHNRQSLEVGLVGGFEPGRVYRITLLPVVADLFGNATRDPFELVFSTGPELTPTVVAGLVWDRTTGRGVSELQVLARAVEDSAVHLARTDTGGIYAFRYLPPGSYQLQAFQDQNGNQEVDAMEVQGGSRLLLGMGDTILTDVGVLQPDTTPAVLTAAEVLDSTTLLVRFDDFLSTQANLGTGNVGLQALDMTDSAALAEAGQEDAPLPVSDTLKAPAITGVFQEFEYRAFVQERIAEIQRQDSLRRVQMAAARSAGDSVRADSLSTASSPPPPPALPGGGVGSRQGAALTAGSQAGGSQGGAQGAAFPRGPDGQPLPGRRILIRLDAPLVTNQPYRVVATGVVNLAGMPLGGGDAVVVRTPPPEPDSAEADSLAADSVAADTLQVPQGSSTDSVPAADSMGPAIQPPAPRPDTLPPDTLPPDTMDVARQGRDHDP